MFNSDCSLIFLLYIPLFKSEIVCPIRVTSNRGSNNSVVDFYSLLSLFLLNFKYTIFFHFLVVMLKTNSVS